MSCTGTHYTCAEWQNHTEPHTAAVMVVLYRGLHRGDSAPSAIPTPHFPDLAPKKTTRNKPENSSRHTALNFCVSPELPVFFLWFYTQTPGIKMKQGIPHNTSFL